MLPWSGLKSRRHIHKTASKDVEREKRTELRIARLSSESASSLAHKLSIITSYLFLNLIYFQVDPNTDVFFLINVVIKNPVVVLNSPVYLVVTCGILEQLLIISRLDGEKKALPSFASIDIFSVTGSCILFENFFG